MEKTDIRKMEKDAKEELIKKALYKYDHCQNISQVARELSINRQLVHSWINKAQLGKKADQINQIGRQELKLLYQAQINKIHDILSNKLPAEEGIEGYFWSVSSVQKLIKKIYIYRSTHIVRKYFKDKGFSKGASDAFKMQVECRGELVALRDYSKKQNLLCYFFQENEIFRPSKTWSYYCLTSTRGDMRFVGKNCWDRLHRYWGISTYIAKIQELAKKKIVVIIPSNLSVGMISKNIILLDEKDGVLVDRREHYA